MSDKYLNAIFRIFVISLMVGYQVLNFFFWQSDEPTGQYAIVPFRTLIPFMIVGFVFPIIALPILFIINKATNPEWLKGSSIEAPSLNADFFNMESPLNNYQDAGYAILAYGLPNFILYLIFKAKFNMGAAATCVGFGILIGVQIILRKHRGKY